MVLNTHIIVIFLDFKIELEDDFMIKFIEKERYYDDSPYTGSCYYYPTYMAKDRKNSLYSIEEILTMNGR